MRPSFWVAALVLNGACMLGAPVSKFPPANGPQGVTADLQLTNDVAIHGELLVVADTALILLQPGSAGITAVRYSSLRNGDFSQVLNVRFFGAPDAGTLGRLRRMSRFPQGLTAELMERLLDTRNQREPTVY